MMRQRVSGAERGPFHMPKLVIGEGAEDWGFFKALLQHLGIRDVDVEHYKGRHGLRPYLKALPSRPGFEQLVSLGVTRDSNGSSESALTSVKDALAASPLLAPSGRGG